MNNARRFFAGINKKNTNLFIRRVHLYSGLFLVPWVFLYGVTAFLFNHPDFFSTSKKSVHPLPEQFQPWTDSDLLADKVVASFTEEESLKRVGPAAFSGRIVLRYRGDTNGSMVLNLKKGTVTSRDRAAQAPLPPGPLDGVVALEYPELTDQLLKDAAKAMLNQQNIQPKTIQVRSVPDVVFDVEYKGEILRASYDLESNKFSTKPLEAVQGPHWRSFLLRLHKAHVYRDDLARFAWAIIVDVMAFAMVIWGASGLYMWWRMKKLRRIGKIMIVISVAVAFLMGLGMFWALSR